MKTNTLNAPARSTSEHDGASADHLTAVLRASELRYRRLFETAQDGILILNAESGEILDVNPFLIDLLDYPFEELLGRKLWEIGQFKDIAANHSAFEKLQQNEYIRYENLPLQRRDGKEIHVEFVSNVYWVGANKVIQCNIRDISVRAKSQAVAKSHIDTLELAGKARDEANAVLFHELRNPLAAISSMIDLLEMGHDTAGRPDETELPPLFDKSALAFIRRNVQSLVRLVNELLEFTHVMNEAIGMELVRLNAHEVVRVALKNLEGQQKGAGVGIELRLEARQRHIRGDPLKLEQVLSNLIGNALKFTPRGGKVSIVTRNEASGTLVMEVSDSGIGISKDALSRIFSPFEQGDPSIHPRFGGLGLGLSIAQTLTKAQGGTLEAVSEGLNKGAKFTARFKIDDSPSGNTIQANVSNAANSGNPAASTNGDTRHPELVGSADGEGKDANHSAA